MFRYSIVIPTYNNKKLLKNTLEALNDQVGVEEGSYEVVVVDDGSSDDTQSYVQDVARTFHLNYIYVPRTNDSCRARVRNIGWQKATGTYVVFLDSDMIVMKDYLKEMDRFFNTDENMLVIGYRYMLDDQVDYEDVRSGKIYEKNYRQLKYYEIRHFEALNHSFNYKCIKHPWHSVYTCNMAISKANIEKLGGFDEGYKGWGLEDTDIGYRAHLAGMDVVMHLGIETLHQYHGEIVGDVKDIRKFVDWDRNITRFYQLFPELNQKFPRWKLNLGMFFNAMYFVINRDVSIKRVHEITVEHESDLPAIKEKIRELSEQEGNEIKVHDHISSVDLNLWIQQLGFTKSIIKHYPKAFMYSKKDVKKIQRQLYDFKHFVILTYRCAILMGYKFKSIFIKQRIQT